MRPTALTLKRFSATGCIAFGLFVSCPTRADEAQTGKPPTASALFREARALAESGNYSDACPKFEASLKLNVGIGTQFNLADCYEHLGRFASAQSLFMAAAEGAHSAGQSEREQAAKARADSLQPKLSRLLIEVPESTPELVVTRNHERVTRETWGVATPVDPGSYLIEASAPGRKSWSTSVVIASTPGDAASVVVPALELASSEQAPAASPDPDPASLGNSAADANAGRPFEPDPPRRSARRTAYALSIAGFGLAAMGTGIVLGLEYRSKNEEAKTVCPARLACSQGDISHHQELVSDARSFRNWWVARRWRGRPFCTSCRP